MRVSSRAKTASSLLFFNLVVRRGWGGGAIYEQRLASGETASCETRGKLLKINFNFPRAAALVPSLSRLPQWRNGEKTGTDN